MKKLFAVFVLLLSAINFAHAREISVTVHKLDAAMNVGESIGVIVVKQTAGGVTFTPFLRNLSPGELQFSVNEHVGCQGKMGKDGAFIPGMAAGTALQQLPPMHVNPAGEASQSVVARNIHLNDIIGKTLVLGKPASGNAANAWGQDRLACGSLETYTK